MKKIQLILALLFATFYLQAQTQVNLSIAHQINGGNFALNQGFKNNVNDDFSLTQVVYYISQITLFHDGGMQTPVTGKYLFVNAASGTFVQNLGSFSGITNMDSIKFYVGVDSPNNHVDPSLFPNGDPLAVTIPEMYWGWAAGRRFVRMEGKIRPSLSETFQLHGLGNQNYWSQTIPVKGYANGSGITIFLKGDYAKGLTDIVTTGVTSLIHHGDNLEDRTMLENFRDHVFSEAWPSQTLNLDLEKNLELYPNPSKGNFQLIIPSSYKNGEIVIQDLTGKLVSKISLDNTMAQSIDIQQKGMYLISVSKDGKRLKTEKLLVE